MLLPVEGLRGAVERLAKPLGLAFQGSISLPLVEDALSRLLKGLLPRSPSLRLVD